jgi:hypothetical protein
METMVDAQARILPRGDDHRVDPRVTVLHEVDNSDPISLTTAQVQEGDIMLVAITTRDSTGPTDPGDPGGGGTPWKELYHTTVYDADNFVGLWWKVAGPAEPSAITFNTVGGPRTPGAVLVIFRPYGIGPPYQMTWQYNVSDSSWDPLPDVPAGSVAFGFVHNVGSIRLHQQASFHDGMEGIRATGPNVYDNPVVLTFWRPIYEREDIGSNIDVPNFEYTATFCLATNGYIQGALIEE